MRTYIKLEAPFEWVRVDGKNVDAFGQVPSLDDYPLVDDNEVIGVVSGEWVTVQKVSIPAKTKKQFYAALPYALEEVLSEDVEDMHFVCPNWKSAEDCNVSIVSKQKMREWQRLANTHKLPIDRLVPDYDLLPFHDAAEYSLAQTGQQLLSNNHNGFGANLDLDFIDLWLMEVPVDATIAVNDQTLAEQLIESNPDRDIRHWPFGDKMAHWLEYLSDSKMDLWTDTFRPSVRIFNWRQFVLPVMTLCLAVFIKFSYDTYRYFALHSEVRAIRSEMQEVLASTFPNLGEVQAGQEIKMMREALSRLNNPAQSKNFQSVLAEVSSVIKGQRATLANLTYRDDRLEITIALNNFAQVDQVTNQLNSRPGIDADLLSSSADDGEVFASFAIDHS
ncbi:MAG: hypothetical protein KTR16_10995 [Acidiferrobacterales bacterium]|nr:hypothetical protein [Acidiferrobacterales bacterium]